MSEEKVQNNKTEEEGGKMERGENIVNKEGEEEIVHNKTDRKDQSVKRVIKIPLPDILRKKMKTNSAEKEWQPMTIEQFKKDKAATTTDKKLNTVAKDFLLPKPKNTETSRPKHNYSFPKMMPKPLIDLNNPTQEQLKHDIDDQSFIVKEFEKPNLNPNLRQRFQDELPEIKQQDLPEDFKGKRITNLTKESLIDADWERKLKEKKMRLTLWEGASDVVNSVSGTAREKNQINALLEDAMKRAEEIDFEMGKKSTERKAMKNRYGW